MRLSGRAKLAGVMGWPVGHSRSPALHGYWLEKLAIDGAYLPLPVRPEDFETVYRALPLMGFAGVNVTLPHKEQALALADRVDPQAQRIGAVNTLVVAADGAVEGSNTDAFGFIENLHQDGFQSAGGPAVVIGAGGASRAVIAALQDDGAPEIRLINRSRDRAETVAAALGGEISVIDWRDRAAALAGAHCLVNTTSLGMVGQPTLDLPLDDLPLSALVTDIVYTPLATDLLVRAAARGNRTVDGLGMLLHQARPGFAAWFGVWPEVDGALRAAVLA